MAKERNFSRGTQAPEGCGDRARAGQLKANIAKATQTLVKHLDSKRENISIRAAEDIIQFTQKALELENIQERIYALEEQMAQRQTESSYR